MRALTVEPGTPDSARLEEFPEPTAGPGDLLVETLAIGLCGTDREILAGTYGSAPDGRQRLVLGHESLGQVLHAPAGSVFRRGDLVTGIVRRPDPVPCAACAAGEWDMCRNARYTERGIKQRDGYAAERVVLEEPYAIRAPASLGLAGVLIEPASVVAKAWQQVERISQRAYWTGRRALVTGAGPVGLLAALLGRQRGYEVFVLDRVQDGPKPALVRSLGARYLDCAPGEVDCAPDVVIECTGAGGVVLEALRATAPGAIVCLTGLSSGTRAIPVDMGAVNRSMVLENEVVFGSVNANRAHYEAAAQALEAADRAWLEAIVRRRVPLERWPEALERRPDDIKTILVFAG